MFSADLFVKSLAPHKASMSYLAMLEHKRFRNKHSARQAMQRLRRAGYIRAQQRGADLILSLTSKGETQAIVACLRRQPRQRLTDGKICLVTYDIPEGARFARDAFRYLLKALGFRRIQASVWESPFDVADHLRYFVQLNKAEDWISVFIAKEIHEIIISRPENSKPPKKST